MYYKGDLYVFWVFGVLIFELCKWVMEVIVKDYFGIMVYEVLMEYGVVKSLF